MKDNYDLAYEILELDKRIKYLEHLEDANPANKKFKPDQKSAQMLRDYVARRGPMDIIDAKRVLKMSNTRKALLAMKKVIEFYPEDIYLHKITSGKYLLMAVYDSDFQKEYWPEWKPENKD